MGNAKYDGPQIFLGGTAANNNWREAFTSALVEKGINAENIFNPVVKDWNEEAQKREELVKANASHLVFYIADPKQDGNPLSAYSMVEAVMALYDKPERTVVVFDIDGMSGHPLKAMNQTFNVLKQRFADESKYNIFKTPAEAVAWFK